MSKCLSKLLFINLLLIFFISSLDVFAYQNFQPGSNVLNEGQQKGIKGRVVDSKGESLPGVTVVKKGTTYGTTTDIDGNFSLPGIKTGDIIVFSFVGMQTTDKKIENLTVIDVTMLPELINLKEVVAIGYGSQRKKDLTGSVASIGTEDLNSLPLSSVGEAMQGKAAGVLINSGGVPGTDPTFRIRGIGTINNNNPLLVIDGVPTQSGLNQLDMNDVKSIQILKDASATAIYGSRGANGVVIVTTKKGKSGKGVLSFNAYYGIQEVTNMVDMLNASEFASLHNDMLSNAGLEKNLDFSDPSKLGSGTDWVGEMFSSAPTQNYSLSYSGGHEKSSYYVSGSYLNQEGIVNNTGFKRYSLKLNSDNEIFNGIRFGNNITLTHSDKHNGDYSIIDAMKALPTQPIYNDDGSYSGPVGKPIWYGDIVNPIGRSKLNKNNTLGYNLMGSIYGEIEIVDGLKFKTLAGCKADFWETRSWAPKYNWQPTPQEQSYLGEGWNRSITWNWDNTLTYQTVINELHKFTVLAGTSAQENKYKFMNGSIQQFASNLTQQLDNGLSQKNIGGNKSEWSLMSYMGRLNYSFSDKYLATFTIRHDGSSRFGTNNKWGTFPSGSIAWRISEENFFSEFNSVDDLKLRAGYGVTGNQEIGNYSFASALNIIKYTFNDNLVNAVVPVVMPNPDVQWESQKQANIGFDATLFDQCVNITFDTYLKKTEDMLVPASIPISSGYSDVIVPSINAGEIENKGIELTVSTHNIRGEFTWNTDFNISYNKNEVKSLNDTIPMVRGDVGFNQQISRIEVGQPMDVFYGFVTDGIFQNEKEVAEHAKQVPGEDEYSRTSAGDIRFLDLNNDGKIDDNDRTYIGDPNPDFIFALNNSFSYKGFDLSIFLQGVYGNDIYNANRIWNEGMAVAQNQTKETLNRWKGEGTNNNMPRAIFNDPNKNIRPSDRFVEDGSYLRVKNVILGYNLPSHLVQKAHISSARIYISGTNLLTFTKYNGFDPEVNVSGIDLNTYPVTKTYSLGVNISL